MGIKLRTVAMTFNMYLLIISIASFVCGCMNTEKYSAQLNTVDTLMKALYRNDTTRVGDLIGINPERIGEDMPRFKHRVRATAEYIQETGLPDRTTYKIKKYPKESADLIDVIVPFKKGGGDMTIRFVKFLPPDKIAIFQTNTPITEGKILAPE